LLLTLPLVPLHAEVSECAVQKDAPEIRDESPAHETQKPFERLGELLKRDH
jgi:uncharacterized metal-binding protein YceD (DUF177 family)